MSLSSLMEEYDQNFKAYSESNNDDTKSKILDKIAELEILIKEERSRYFNSKDGGMIPVNK